MSSLALFSGICCFFDSSKGAVKVFRTRERFDVDLCLLVQQSRFSSESIGLQGEHECIIGDDLTTSRVCSAKFGDCENDSMYILFAVVGKQSVGSLDNVAAPKMVKTRSKGTCGT